MSTIVFMTIEEAVVTWRTLWPARELLRRGYEVEVYAKYAGVPEPKIEPIEDVTYVLHVINRAWGLRGLDGRTTRYFNFAEIASWIRDAGRLVLSIDDDWTQMLEIQARPKDEESIRNMAVSKEVHKRLRVLVQMAEKVIVSTPRLAEVYGEWAPTEVVPNVLPEWVLGLPRPPRVERLAWMGEMYVHGMDWNPLQAYAKDLPPLRLIGSGEAAAERIRSWGARDVEVTAGGAILNQRELYTEIGRAVGAVIPLADTPFNRGKSWSKPMEFLARSVPVVASEHAEYRRLDEETHGAVPTFETTEGLMAAATELWETRRSGDDGPERLRAAGLTMEQLGGDAWEKALAD